MERLEPASGDALLAMDVQNDFLPGGSLARLPELLRRLEEVGIYPVEIAPGLRELAQRLDLVRPDGE